MTRTIPYASNMMNHRWDNVMLCIAIAKRMDRLGLLRRWSEEQEGGSPLPTFLEHHPPTTAIWYFFSGQPTTEVKTRMTKVKNKNKITYQSKF